MSNDVALGQLGSAFVDDTGAITPPTGKVIVAVTFLSDLRLDSSEGLVAELPTDATFKGPQTSAGVAEINSFGSTAQTTANGGNSERVDSSQVFPKGITVYGRWRSFLLSAADSTGGAICYFGY
mgnify:CR=1 FL=1